MTKATTKKKAEKMYRVTGKEAPIRVDMPEAEPVYYEAGQEFKGSDWPMAHITIPQAVKAELIEEV